MRDNPFRGDIARLKGERAAWRQRVGNYRIFVDIYPERHGSRGKKLVRAKLSVGC